MESVAAVGPFVSIVTSWNDVKQSVRASVIRIVIDRYQSVAIVELERPIEIFARLNVQHGPNTEQIVRELPVVDRQMMVEFDLAYTKLNEKRVEKLWIDLIFENPEMSQVVLRDLFFSRRPRAEL